MVFVSVLSVSSSIGEVLFVFVVYSVSSLVVHVMVKVINVGGSCWLMIFLCIGSSVFVSRNVAIRVLVVLFELVVLVVNRMMLSGSIENVMCLFSDVMRRWCMGCFD